ncbi:head GIN domain-containing protein [Sandarakinorhabdus limnophila]|jgi:hypothetical protein|uniref:head GIN domain-containing protein n=1 Tax=Sandarakinorhabdus limnophila TaxID=210512 RepID=UPI0037C985B8
MIRPALLLLTAAIAAAPANAAERRFDASGFDKVALGGSDNVSVRQGNGYSVIASGEAADLDKLEVRVEKGVLHIGRKKGNWGWGGKDVNVAVTLPALHGLSLAGSADVQADKGSGDTFDIRVAGSGNLMLASLDTRTANVAISGSGDVKVAGRCGALNVKIAGSGNVSARASGQADVRIAGSGDVRITGGARCIEKVAGSGTVQCS